MLQFTAPREGTYVFETALFERWADSVLFVRSHCRYPGPTAELACNDDADDGGRDLSSRVALDLAEDQTVYVFVDGYAAGRRSWQGEYSLIVRRD